ncbi:MAG: hypothetical protein M3M94_02680 [Actinomycetota bacterium]|nr:hypothetical protein [Actinomycetota bacterium]
MDDLGRKLKLAVIAVALVAAIAGTGPAGAHKIGNEGCTPGYWKNHTSNWQEYRPSSRLGYNFAIPARLAGFRDDTFLQALKYKGGSGVNGAARILFRSAVAAYLNAAHEGVGYPYRRFREPGNLQRQVNRALASLDRQTMLALAKKLDQANNLGCPLS